MSTRILSITAFVPQQVGDLRYEFRVELLIDDAEHSLAVTAEQLADYRLFQSAVLSKLGVWVTFDISSPSCDAELHWAWQNKLRLTNWRQQFEGGVRPVAEEEEEDSEFGFADEQR